VVVATVLTLGASAQAQRHAPTPAANRSGPPAADVQPATPGQPAKPGAAALARARAAWDKGDFDVAEPLYQEAIETGGLDPAEVLDAYVRLGSVCSVLGKKATALAAFKVAALLDPHFVLPPEAGKRAALVANRARQASARAGAITLGATIPSDVVSGEAAQVDATLDPAHVAVASAIALSARDPLSGRSYADSQDPAAAIHFKLPASLMLPSAMLSVRVDALDAHQNRLATVEGRTHVRAAALAPDAPIALAPVLPLDGSGKATTDEGKDHKSGGGFWSTAWPYVIGGVALAAGGAAIYLATRSSDDVDVGAVHVLTR
jgi:tetratricopeptide (TPR) repeat protein